jgi:Holliday junction resolvasome RuvABC endonuclease subunit
MTIAPGELRGRLRERRKPAPPPWKPPPLLAFRGFLRLLAWDATLSHCGYVLLERTHHLVVIHDRGTIHPKTDLTGYLSTWEKGRLLQAEIRGVQADHKGVTQVVESPSVAGSRLESSLVAGLLVWLETVGPAGTGCAQVSATHVSSVLLGNPRIKSAERKKMIKEAVARYVPGSEARPWNEHERDALAVGLTHLYDLNQRLGTFTMPSFT